MNYYLLIFGDKYAVKVERKNSREFPAHYYIYDSNYKYLGSAESIKNKSEIKSNRLTESDFEGTKFVSFKFANGGAMMQNQQLINDASQSYVNYYLNDGGGVFKDGGSIPNNYEGRTPEDIWSNLTIEQRRHFLFDHQEELPERFTGYYVVNELAKRDFDSSPKEVKFIFEIHVKTGQYAYGGKTKSAKSMKEIYIEQIASLTNLRPIGVEKFVDENN
jgi:hypothetical protein